MNTRVLTLVLLCISMPGFSAGEIPVQADDKDKAVDYSELVNGLSWGFKQSSTVVSDEQEKAGIATRYEFISTEPLKKASQGNVYLKIDLTVTVYNTAEKSIEAWGRIKEKADPDMGLSYAWDYLLLQDRFLYHLHAGCLMSEDNFDTMVNNLSKRVQKQVGNEPKVLRCRCGGGCRTPQ